MGLARVLFGLLDDGMQLDGFFAFLDGAVHIGAGYRCVFVVADGVEGKDFGIVVFVGLPNGVVAFFKGLLAVEKRVVACGNVVITACRPGVFSSTNCNYRI